MINAREAAFFVLSKISKDNGYSNLVLNDALNEYDMTERDAALAHRLVKCVLERRITTDYILSKYLTQPLKKLKPQVLTVLRMGACQLLFMDKIPQSAAINESVNLTKKHKCAFASGLVNAVLRKVAAGGLTFPDEKNEAEYLSVKYSFEKYITEMLLSYYGRETAEKIMESSLSETKVYIRKNSLKNNELNIANEECGVLDDCRVLTYKGNMARHEDFMKGMFHVQDLSSQIAVSVLDCHENDTVIDVCAAPGGKSMTIAEYMNNKGKVISCDVYEHKLKLINDTAKRLGINIIEAVIRDGADEKAELPKADRILCDVPCSGFGVTGKKPEIKYKSKEEIASLPSLQYKILCNSSKYLKENGRLVYSTCTLNPDENINICKKFLSEHEDFESVHIDDSFEGLRDGETLTVLPYIYGCDGFFVAAFERRKSNG